MSKSRRAKRHTRSSFTFAIAEPIEPRFLLSFTPYVSGKWTAIPGYEYYNVKTGQTGTATPFGSTSPAGAPLTPTTMRNAYGLGTLGSSNVTFNGIQGDGSGQTIAIIDVGSDPTIATDLTGFDNYYGLPDPPSFQQLSQTGSTTNLPGVAAGWVGEISLDVEWSHVMAPKANIILFAASDLYAAAQYAATYPGVSVISMSFGISGNAPDSDFLTPTGHTGVTWVAATGDTASEVGSPAQSPNVVAVGGTDLNLNGNYYGSEDAWAAGGGGISTSESQPAYQKGIVSAYSTTQRTIPDVAMDADPGTGVAIYSVTDTGSTSAPWELIIGGTSLASPLFAGVVAVADQGRAAAGLTPMDGSTQTLPRLYQLSQANYDNFHDITTGSNGHPATVGYDLATGLGSAEGNYLIPDLAGADNISGRAFIDTNGNGVYDAGTDTVLANKTVYLDLNNNGVQDPTDPTATTNVSGQYSFSDVIGSFTGVVRLAGTSGYLPETTSTITTAYNTSQTYNLIFSSAASYAATATPNPVTNNTTALGVTVTGGTPASGLTYTWSATSEPTGSAPVFSVNGTAGAVNPTVTFNHVGSYTFTVKITDAAGHTATTSVTVSVTGLAAYYKMNEGTGATTVDASGNGNTATLSNTTWTTGVAGDGLAFDGSSSEVTVPPLNLNSNTVTMSAWIDGTGTQSQYAGLVFNRDGSNGNGINIYSGNTLGYTWGSVGSTSGWNSGLTFTSGVWTFVAVVITASKATLYMQPLGGTMVTAVNNVSNLAEPFDGVTQIGQDAYSTARTFNGSMDEVRIYNTALSASAISGLGKSSSFLTAVNDTVIAAAGSPGTVDVLTNDGSANGTTISITSFTQGGKGTVTNAGNGNLTYTTTATIGGTDSFTYTISDGVGDTSTATVNVTIDGLDAYYEFNEGTGATTADATGNGNTAALNGTAWTTGISGAGLSFNGTSSEATVPALNLNTNTATFSGWINSNTSSQAGYTGLIFNRDGANGNGLDIYNGNELGYTWGQSSSSNFYSGLAIPTNTWTFVALVITANNAVLYMQPVNGTMTSATNTLANDVEPFSNAIQIGQDAYSAARTFSGLMDEVRIYDVALTPAAIATLGTTTSFLTAANYAVTTTAGSPTTVNVLAKDSIADASKPLSITSYSQGSKGTVTAGTTGNLIYTTTSTVAGTDSFTYTITDASGHTATATVTVSILGLDAYYKMNEGSGISTADATGNGYTAALNQTSWTTGIGGTAGLAFNGTSSEATIQPLKLNTNTATFTAWIDSSGSQSQYAGLVFNRDGSNGNGLNFYSSGNMLGYTWGSVAGTSGWNSGLTVPTGVWTFVAVVITPTNATLYMEPMGGSMQTATNAVANLAEPFSGLTQIGQDAYSTSRTFKGSMDEVQIYNEALTPAAVSAIVNTPPTVATAAAASPSTVTGTSTALSVLGASPAGESTLKYTWTATSIPTGAAQPTYSVNGTNAAKNTTATFSQAGAYTFQVTITDALGQSVTSSVSVIVNQTFTRIAVTPAAASIFDGQTTQVFATANDQFGNAMAVQPTFTWSTNLGTIGSSGLFTAPASGAGTATVQATSGSVTGSTAITVILSVINGTAGDDTIRLVRSGANLLVYVDNPTTALYNVPFATLGSLTVLPGTGTDNINVDFSGGASPVPSAGISVSGGSGTDTLVLTGTTGADTVAINATTATLNGSAAIGYSGIESIIFNGNGGADTLNQNAQPGNSATLSFNGATAGGPSIADTLNVNAGNYAFASQSPGSGSNPLSLNLLSIANGSAVSVAAATALSDRWVLSLNALSIGGSTAKLDLGNNDLILHNVSSSAAATAIATINSELQSGRTAAGTWNGPGISSSAIQPGSLEALGSALNNGLFTSFDNQPVVSTDVLVKYTYVGDANLDGIVDGSDYTKIDYGFLTQSTGWANGDFNYDGKIDGSDYTLIDNAFNTQGAAQTAQVAATAAANSQATTSPKVFQFAKSVQPAQVTVSQKTVVSCQNVFQSCAPVAFPDLAMQIINSLENKDVLDTLAVSALKVGIASAR